MIICQIHHPIYQTIVILAIIYRYRDIRKFNCLFLGKNMFFVGKMKSREIEREEEEERRDERRREKSLDEEREREQTMNRREPSMMYAYSTKRAQN